MPRTSFTRRARSTSWRGCGIGRPSAETPPRSVPPAISRMRATSRSAAAETSAAATPRSKRWLESLRIVWRRLAERTETGSKVAASTRIEVVSSVTAVSAPPLTPASATGRSASAMTRSSEASPIGVAPSPSGRNGSRSFAIRISMRPPRSFARSKTWVGWPSSKRTKLVASTRLLRGICPIDSSRRRSHSGLGPTLTPSMTRPV